MATVLDTFVVELGLDPSKFTQGQKDAYAALKNLQEQSLAGGKAIESEGKKTEEYFSTLKRGALGLLAVFLGGRGIKDFVGYITGLDASMGRLAPQLKMTTAELSAWQMAFERVGGTAQDAQSFLQGFFGAVQQFKFTGQGPLTEAAGVFAKLGIDLYDANKEFKTANQLALELADAIKREGMNAADAAAHLKFIPGINQTAINLLLKGPEFMKQLLAEGRSISSVTDESAAAAEKLASAWEKALQSSVSFGRNILTVITPALLAVLALSDLLRSKFTPEEKKEVQERGDRQHRDLRQRFGEPTGFMKELSDWLSIRDEVPSTGQWLRMTNTDVQKWKSTHPPAPAPAPAPAPPLSLMRQTRGDRNNNPGNIESGPFATAHGATGSDGRFAIFPTKEMGEKAMADLLSARYSGLTIAQIQRKWVGYTEPGYVASMSKATGVGANEVPDLRNPEMVRKMMFGMTRGEGTQLSAGLRLPAAPPIAGASGAAAVRGGGARGGDTKTVTSTVSIGTINLPNVKDAESFAREIKPAMERGAVAAQADYALW